MKAIVSFVCSCLLLAAVPVQAKDEIKVLTQNQYLGADLSPLLAAKNGAEFNTALVQVLQQIAANRFVERVQRQAKEIAERKPDIVALQEVWRFECIDAVDPPIADVGCNDPSIAGAFVDHLAYTLAALEARGAHYHVAAQVKNLDVMALVDTDMFPGLPFEIDGVYAFLRALDRDVILVRDGVEAAPAPFQDFSPALCGTVSLDGCNYGVVASAMIQDVGEVRLLRGFVGVDVKIRGQEYRVVNTHLEQREPEPGNKETRAIQSFQALELMLTLDSTALPGQKLIVLGDMNSAPEDQTVTTQYGDAVPPYMQFAGMGYTDTWTLRHREEPGSTCCQAENLSNRRSELYERVDLIWSLEAPAKVKRARVVGIKISDKTPPAGKGIWPSDHGGVAVDLKY